MSKLEPWRADRRETERRRQALPVAMERRRGDRRATAVAAHLWQGLHAGGRAR